MSNINDRLVAEAESFISALMAEKLSENMLFHNFSRTLLVKKYAEAIGEQEQAGLDAGEMNILRICALFCEAGYVNSYEDWNGESIAIASAFLADHGIDRQTVDQIAGVIRSAGIPPEPKDKIAEAICDAVMMYIASDNGIEQFDLLVDECALMNIKAAKRQSCEKEQLQFLGNHAYFTEYGKTVLQPAKEAALARISERIKRRKQLENKKDAEVKKRISFTRGVDTMFRVTARNQINLNSIADKKSNILISVNAIVISIIITVLAGKVGDMSHNMLPILVFLVMCLITIIIAILSTRPNIVTTKFTEEDLKNKNVDLTFFGNFDKLDYDVYLKAFMDMIGDEDHLYSTLIKNQYSLGKILSKKFKLLKIAYNVFMIGIIITVIIFLVNYFRMSSF